MTQEDLEKDIERICNHHLSNVQERKSLFEFSKLIALDAFNLGLEKAREIYKA